MRKFLFLLGLLAPFLGVPAQAQQIQCIVTATGQFAPCAIGTYPFQALGYQQITSLSAATTLTVPAGIPTISEICVEAQGVRYRDDGTAPTASVGMPVAAGTCFQYSGPLKTVQFIQQTSGAILNVSYYR